MALPDDILPDETPLPETGDAPEAQEARATPIEETKGQHSETMEDMGDVAVAEAGLEPAVAPAGGKLPTERKTSRKSPGARETLPKAERQKRVQLRAQQRGAARMARLGKVPTAKSRRGQAYDQGILDDLSKVASSSSVPLFPQDANFIPGSGDEKFPIGDQMADRASSEAEYRVAEQLRNAAELSLFRTLAAMSREMARELEDIRTLLERDRLS
jgi:hypothetical protein